MNADILKTLETIEDNLHYPMIEKYLTRSDFHEKLLVEDILKEEHFVSPDDSWDDIYLTRKEHADHLVDAGILTSREFKSRVEYRLTPEARNLFKGLLLL